LWAAYGLCCVGGIVNITEADLLGRDIVRIGNVGDVLGEIRPGRGISRARVNLDGAGGQLDGATAAHFQ
jgi:hypothetical protein